MSFFEDASLVLIPSAIKDQKVYSVKPTDGTGDLTFSRASSASRVASNGLIEKVRTNLALYSEQFDNAYWAKTNTTVVANSGIAPNGTTTAELIYPTTTGSNRLLEKSFSISASTPYTGTWYLKASGLSWVAVDHIDGNVGAWFNLSTGTIGTITSGCTASIVSFGNGWYRCRVSRTSAGGTGYHVIRLVDGDNVISVTANGTDGVLVWGAQLESGDIATDYIATTSAAVSVGPVSGLPRLDYLNSTCPRLLLEPQRTNLATYSEQINNAAWLKEDILSVTANAIVSPDGFTNADLVIPNTTSTDHTIYQIATAAVSQTFSVFAKAGGYNFIFLGANNGLASDGVFFNLTNGTISQNTSVFTAKIESYGNGWYRCSISAASWPLIYAIICTSANGTSFVHAGNGTSGVHVWGAQLELGAYATSYIPTLGTSVTRVADAASKTGISSLIGQTEGVIFIDFVYTNLDSNGLIPITIGTDSSNHAYLYIEGTERITFDFIVAGTATGRIRTAEGYAVKGTRYKFAFAYKANDFAAYINGQLIGTDNSGAITALSNFYFGYPYAAGYSTPNTINQTLLFKTRLTNAQLAELTTL
jgi:hypothetical protein